MCRLKLGDADSMQCATFLLVGVNPPPSRQHDPTMPSIHHDGTLPPSFRTTLNTVLDPANCSGSLLLPATASHFAVDHVLYHGKMPAIVWDVDGSHYGLGI